MSKTQCGSGSWARAPAAASRNGTAIAPIAAPSAPARRDFRPRTQSSFAVSANGADWLLLNASPDLREQIAAAPQLAPGPMTILRASPIKAVALTNGDVDHVAGLLNLREAQPFSLYAAGRVLDALGANPIFTILQTQLVPRIELRMDEAVALSRRRRRSRARDPRLSRARARSRSISKNANAPNFGTAAGDTLGLEDHRDEDGQILLLHSRLRQGRRAARRPTARRRARLLRRHAVPRERDDRAGSAGQDRFAHGPCQHERRRRLHRRFRAARRDAQDLCAHQQFESLCSTNSRTNMRSPKRPAGKSARMVWRSSCERDRSHGLARRRAALPRRIRSRDPRCRRRALSRQARIS